MKCLSFFRFSEVSFSVCQVIGLGIPSEISSTTRPRIPQMEPPRTKPIDPAMVYLLTV